MKRVAGKFLFLVMAFGLTGCAISRSHIPIEIPAANQSVEENGHQVLIRSIVDKRQFQNHPPSADMPSLRGDVETAGSEIKSRAVGRKRNTFGKALGDILLDEGETVENVVYQATRNSLISLGYKVTNKKEEARPGAIVMDITIEKFWGWFAPGFSSIQLKSDISTTHKIDNPKRPGENVTKIEAHAVNSYQMATNANWKKTFHSALLDFSGKAKLNFERLHES